ncbi:MAG: ATP-binding protein [Bacteroidota bacterium]
MKVEKHKSSRQRGAFLKYLFTLGLEPEQSFSVKRDLIFANQSLFIVMVIFPCVFISYILNGYFLRSLIPLTTICLLPLGFIMMKKQYYWWAKGWAVGLSLCACISSSLIFGLDAGEHFYIFPILIMACLNFHYPRWQFALMIVHMLAFSGTIYYGRHYEPYITGQDSELLGYFQLCFIVSIIYVAISQLVRHYEQYDIRINKLLGEISEKNQTLRDQRDQIEQQAQTLQCINSDLEAQMAEKEKAQQAALESNQELERFAYVASHDLKEPLRTVGNFTKVLKMKYGQNWDQHGEQYYHFITDGVERMSAMLEDLLALSKLNGKLEFGKVDLQETVAAIGQSLQQLLERCEGEIEFSSLPTIIANQTQMTQLLQNLIANGIKFKKPNVPSRIEVKVVERRLDYLFSVKDNGIGIPKQHQQKVFTLFQRLHKKEAYEGTGIGLTVCKKIVQNHGGTIWIESEEGVGTTMFFTIEKQAEQYTAVDITSVITDSTPVRRNTPV